MTAPSALPLDRPIRLGVLISGGGTTLVNFLEKIQAGELDAEIALVVASRPDCGGIAKAKAAGIACQVVSRGEHADVKSFSRAIFDYCRAANVDRREIDGHRTMPVGSCLAVSPLGAVVDLGGCQIPKR